MLYFQILYKTFKRYKIDNQFDLEQTKIDLLLI